MPFTTGFVCQLKCDHLGQVVLLLLFTLNGLQKETSQHRHVELNDSVLLTLVQKTSPYYPVSSETLAVCLSAWARVSAQRVYWVKD